LRSRTALSSALSGRSYSLCVPYSMSRLNDITHAMAAMRVIISSLCWMSSAHCRQIVATPTTGCFHKVRFAEVRVSERRACVTGQFLAENGVKVRSATSAQRRLRDSENSRRSRRRQWRATPLRCAVT
jgi:hypothetical protein